MNERIKEFAEQAGFAVYGWNENEFKKFAELVRADEREECWRTAENYDTGYEAAEAIRARGTT
jgi:hypothetical protein